MPFWIVGKGRVNGRRGGRREVVGWWFSYLVMMDVNLNICFAPLQQLNLQAVDKNFGYFERCVRHRSFTQSASLYLLFSL